MRKLDGLELIHEAQEVIGSNKPFALPGSFKKQNYEYQDMQQKPLNLSLEFATNLVELVSSNLKLNYLKKKTSNKDQEFMETQRERAIQKWEKIGHFMLNVDNMQSKEELPAK